jgi:hypothetical protein
VFFSNPSVVLLLCIIMFWFAFLFLKSVERERCSIYRILGGFALGVKLELIYL